MSKHPSGKRSTLRDVAEYCHLSLATVSRVLANSDYSVSDKTKKLVFEAAKALNYTPNALGRSLKTQNTHKIGVVIPNITNPYYAQLLLGIGDRALQANYSMLMCNSHRLTTVENKGLGMLISERVAGILLASINDDPLLVRQAVDMGIPVVTLEQKPPSTELNGCCHIGFDYAAGAKLAVEYLYRQGHRRIAYVGAPLVYHSRREMLAGYRAAVAEYNLQTGLEWMGTAEADTLRLYEVENGLACARVFTAMPAPPTAYLCINDQSAIGLVRGLQSLGVRVPEDVSVMGFDNIPQAALTTPALTTIDQQAYEMGALAFDKLLEQIQAPGTRAESIMLVPRVVERESVCPPSQ